MSEQIVNKIIQGSVCREIFPEIPLVLNRADVMDLFDSLKGQNGYNIVTRDFTDKLERFGFVVPVKKQREKLFNHEMIIRILWIVEMTLENGLFDPRIVNNNIRSISKFQRKREDLVSTIRKLLESNSFTFLKKETQIEEEITYGEGEVPADFSSWIEQ